MPTWGVALIIGLVCMFCFGVLGTMLNRRKEEKDGIPRRKGLWPSVDSQRDEVSVVKIGGTTTADKVIERVASLSSKRDSFRKLDDDELPELPHTGTEMVGLSPKSREGQTMVSTAL